jgi:hypothetical protein
MKNKFKSKIINVELKIKLKKKEIINERNVKPQKDDRLKMRRVNS